MSTGALLNPQVFGGNQMIVRLLESSRSDAAPSPGDELGARIRAQLGGGQALPASIRTEVETGLGRQLGDVRVHRDTEAAALATELSARAFTTGNDIFFNTGAYNPTTQDGYEVLAHELTHTLQQASGPVAGRLVSPDLAVSDPHDHDEQTAYTTARRITAARDSTVDVADHDGALSALGSSSSATNGHGVQRTVERAEATPISVQRQEQTVGGVCVPPRPAVEQSSTPPPSESTDAVCRERLHVITYQGTQHAIPESQWPAFLAGLKQVFRTQVLRPLESRMNSASGLYESMRELNNDQWAVSWVLEAVRTGINLNEVEAPITRGREALRALHAVAEGDDLAATEAATRDAEQKINAAYAAIVEYRTLQIRVGEATVTALEITQTVCFTIFALAGGAVLAAPVAAGGLGLGAVSSGAIMGGGTALLSSAAAVGGQAVVGEEVGWADLRHVTLDTVAGAAGGALSAGVATRITPYIAPALTRSLVANGLFREVSEALLARAVGGVVAGSAGGVVQGAVMDGVRVLDRRATFEQLLQNVVINLIAGGIAGLIGTQLGGASLGPPEGSRPAPRGGASNPSQNVLVVGAETAGEFAYATDVAAAGQRVTVVNPVATAEAQVFTARGGNFVQGAVQDLPLQPAYTMIREDFPFPLGRAFTPTAEFAAARIDRLAPGGRWVVMTEAPEFAQTLEAVATTRGGVRVTTREIPRHHESVPVSDWPREQIRFILVMEKEPGPAAGMGAAVPR